jgi:hypothetical protein
VPFLYPSRFAYVWLEFKITDHINGVNLDLILDAAPCLRFMSSRADYGSSYPIECENYCADSGMPIGQLTPVPPKPQ